MGGFIPSVSLPPVLTCRKNAPCTKDCYATKRTYKYKNVVESLRYNLNSYTEKPDEFFQEIIAFLNNGLISYKYFRWFAAGDIVDSSFLLGMVKVAKKCKKTRFLCFTKKFELVNEYLKNNTLPKNLKIVFSGWGPDFKIDNPFNLPVSHVRFKEQEKNLIIPVSAIPCTGECQTCVACWSLKEGQTVAFKKH